MIFIGIILSLLPGFVWLLFYLQEDLHPEPKRLLFKTFVIGGLFAFFALFLELLLNSLFANYGIAAYAPLALLAFSLIEESIKFFGTYLSVHNEPAFDEPVDAMIYMVVGSLGFATVENLGAVFNTQTGLLFNIAFETATLRFVGATLLHSLAGGIVGYYWAKSIREFKSDHYIFKGLVFATILHGIFNYLIINYGDIIYSVVFVTIVGFFVLNDFEKLKEKRI